MEYDAFFKFEDIEVVHRDDVPADADAYPSLSNNRIRRNGKKKNRWCLDGSAIARNDAKRSAGLPDDHDDAATTASAETPPYASPCADPTCILIFAALCVTYGYAPCAGDAKNAYLQADPLPPRYACYMRPPRYFDYYLRRRYGRGNEPYDPRTHLFRVLKPVYGPP